MLEVIILTQTELEEIIKVSGADIETNKGESGDHVASGYVAALKKLFDQHIRSY